MRFSRILAIIAVLSLSFPLSLLAGEGNDFLSGLEGAIEEGRIDREEALLNLFRYAFEPEAVRADLAVEGGHPIKCLTPSIIRFEESRDRFSLVAAAEIDGYLSGRGGFGKILTSTYDSPGGHFTLSYETIGVHAPPQADVDPVNGVPDYVEWVAEYCDSSWSREIDGLGFNPPDLAVGERYQISFLNMGAYGYTMSTGHGSSYIVIENDFVGFPANQDPEGNQKGAAKVTCAHEFKHASQMNTTGGMAIGGWVELDATWMEDIVYDETNDYYNYLFSGSSISHPDQSLDYGGSGSYEDCIWQHYLTETYDVNIGLEFMQRREVAPTESALASYAEIIAARGSSFTDEFTEFATWNYMSGIYAQESLPAYEEAANGYPTPTMWSVPEVYPDTSSGSVDRMAAHFYQCKGQGTLAGNMRIRFTGEEGKVQSVAILIKRKTTYGGGWFREDVALDSTNSGDHTISFPGIELRQVGVLVINPRKIGTPASYSLILEDGDASTAVGNAVPIAAPFGLDQNRPNPFNPTTSISFVLAERSAPSLVVYNQAGRVVRTLISGESFGAGSHTVRWDGRDDAGREAASGVYLYRLVSDRHSESKRMILIR